jgi:uncharacterized protein (DUF2249 family)
MATERFLDLSGLEPPEPLDRALHAADTLRAGEYLRMVFPRLPQPLFALLDLYDVEYRSDPGAGPTWEVRAWRKGDAEAAQAANAGVPPGPGA